MKYVVVKTPRGEAAIVFQEEITHADVAKGLDVVSAGFYYVQCQRPVEITLDNRLAVSLPGKKPRLEDVELIRHTVAGMSMLDVENRELLRAYITTRPAHYAKDTSVF